jgi:hypothetical protein
MIYAIEFVNGDLIHVDSEFNLENHEKDLVTVKEAELIANKWVVSKTIYLQMKQVRRFWKVSDK